MSNPQEPQMDPALEAALKRAMDEQAASAQRLAETLARLAEEGK